MELTRTEVIKGVLSEYDAFSELIAELTPDQWSTSTRCRGWEVRDVAGHVVGLSDDVAGGVVGQRTPDEQASALRGESAADMAARLRDNAKQLRPLMDFLDDTAWAGPSAIAGVPLGEAFLRLWFDTYVHADDIRCALGMPSEHGPGLVAGIATVAKALGSQGWGPATLALDGIEPIAVGEGEGPRVEGDPYRFLLAATGRLDPAEVGLDETVNIFR